MTMTHHRRRIAAAAASLAAAATVVATSPVAGAATQYGAIAYSADGSWGRSWDYPTTAAAEAAAVKSCGNSDCKVLLPAFTGCGAVAYNGTKYQGAQGDTLSAATSKALAGLAGGYIDSWTCN